MRKLLVWYLRQMYRLGKWFDVTLNELNEDKKIIVALEKENDFLLDRVAVLSGWKPEDWEAIKKVIEKEYEGGDK